MKHLFFVAQAIAPIGGSHSTRVTHLVTELSKTGWHISILTTKVYEGTPCQDEYLCEKLPNHLEIIRTYPGPLHWTFYRKKCSKEREIISSNRSWKKALFIPDTYFEWLPWAVLKCLFAARYTLRRVDVIMSSAVPYSCHLIALILSYLFRKPLVVDYGDPWVFDPGNPRRGFRYMVEHFLERCVLGRASAVFVTTEATKRLYLEKYGLYSEKVHVLPMAYDPEDFRGVSARSPQKGTLRFVYTGRLEPESRDVKVFLEALASLKKRNKLEGVKFEFAGVFSSSFLVTLKSLDLLDKVVIVPWLNHKECMNYMVNADYLLLFGNNNNIQLPGKIFNYIGSGTPIVYMANNIAKQNDPAIQVLKESKCHYLYAQFNKESIEKTLLSIIENKHNSIWRWVPLPGNTWYDRALALISVVNNISEVSYMKK